MNVAQTLEAGAQYIDDHGWCQGRMLGPNNKVCALGAIAEVTALMSSDGVMRGDVRAYSKAKAVLTEYLHRAYGTGRTGMLITEFNDALGRSQMEVTSAMRAAAALWRAEHESTETEHEQHSVHVLLRHREFGELDERAEVLLRKRQCLQLQSVQEAIA